MGSLSPLTIVGVLAMRSLILDQSTTCTGLAVLEDGKILAHGVIKPPAGTIDERLRNIRKCLADLIQEWQPDELVFENTQFRPKAGGPRRDEAMGRIKEVCASAADFAGIPWYKHHPMSIKHAVTGNGSSSKEDVKIAACRYWKIPVSRLLSPLDDNESDALAGAIHWKYQGSFIRRSTESKGKVKQKRLGLKK